MGQTIKADGMMLTLLAHAKAAAEALERPAAAKGPTEADKERNGSAYNTCAGLARARPRIARFRMI